MDTKRLVIGISLSMALFLGWFLLMSYVDKRYGAQLKKPLDPPAAPAPAPGGVASATAGTQPTTGPVMTARPTTGWQVINSGDALSVPVTLGSPDYKNLNYALGVMAVPRGAGIVSVILNDFRESVDDPKKTPYSFQHPDPAVAPTYGNPLGTRSVTVDGTVVDVSSASWTLEGVPTLDRATYSVTLGTAADAPALKVLKTYRVFERKSTEHPGAGYEVRVDYDFENHTDRSLQLSMSFNGPAMPPKELDTGPDRRVMVGYREGPNVTVDNHYVETFADEDATRELAKHEDNLPLYWVGTSSVYFQAIVMPPVLPTPEGGRRASLSSVKGIGVNPAAAEHPFALVADTDALTVGPNQRLNYPLSVFFGPKWRDVLNEPFYAGLPRDYDQTLVVRSGPCAMCTFDWLINVLVAMLGVFHTVARDWGLAIICLVVLVRLALHPITKRSQISMLKMGKMAPEMKRLQEKYKDDKEELQKAMWQFQKQQGITPILGCLPMFLQMPIWIALWSALNTTFELRHSSFLWGFTWIDDLAKPDRLIPFPAAWGFRIPLIGTVVDALNVLPILLAFVFYLQQKFTPKPAAMTPEQEQQQKIMQWMMVLLFPLFLYGQPSGLNLYILTSTGIGIWESKRIRRHIKEKEEAEKAGVVIVDAEPARPEPSGGGKGGKGKNRDPMPFKTGGGKGGKNAPPAAPGPQSWLARKLAELQEKAEQARRANQRPGGRDRA